MLVSAVFKVQFPQAKYVTLDTNIATQYRITHT